MGFKLGFKGKLWENLADPGSMLFGGAGVSNSLGMKRDEHRTFLDWAGSPVTAGTDAQGAARLGALAFGAWAGAGALGGMGAGAEAGAGAGAGATDWAGLGYGSGEAGMYSGPTGEVMYSSPGYVSPGAGAGYTGGSRFNNMPSFNLGGQRKQPEPDYSYIYTDPATGVEMLGKDRVAQALMRRNMAQNQLI